MRTSMASSENEGVFWRWSIRRPGVAITMSGFLIFFEFQNSLILFLRGNCTAAHLLSVASCTFRSSPPTERPISTEVNWANCLET